MRKFCCCLLSAVNYGCANSVENDVYVNCYLSIDASMQLLPFPQTVSGCFILSAYIDLARHTTAFKQVG